MRTMTIWTRAGIAALALASLTAAGCSAIRKDEAQSKENLLAAAGFQPRPADTPEKLAQLKALPPLKMQVHTKDGQTQWKVAR